MCVVALEVIHGPVKAQSKLKYFMHTKYFIHTHLCIFLHSQAPRVLFGGTLSLDTQCWKLTGFDY